MIRNHLVPQHLPKAFPAAIVEPSIARSGTGVEDIFRVGDIIQYTGQSEDEKAYWEVKELTYTDGVDYSPENNFLNSSSLAKYVTKEISIANPGTSINVKLTANVKDIEDIQVLFRYKSLLVKNLLMLLNINTSMELDYLMFQQLQLLLTLSPVLLRSKNLIKN